MVSANPYPHRQLSIRIEAGLSTRSLQDADLPHVIALATACLEADGGLPLIADEAFLRERFWKPERQQTVGIFHSQELLVAYGVLLFERIAEELRITAHGLVHPAYRRRGLGNALLEWTTSSAEERAGEKTGTEGAVLRLVNETLTEEAIQFYTGRGFSQTFGERIMRFDLRLPLPLSPMPEDLTVESWTDARKSAFFDAYRNSFGDRPGFPNWSQERWVEWIADDPDFRSDYSFLVSEGNTPVAFIACSDNYIAQVGVHPLWRRRGIASALLCRTLACVCDEGFEEALLTVNDNNPAAIAAYLKFGFQQIGRRGRFERSIS